MSDIGRRALELVVAHEFCGGGYSEGFDEYFSACPECGGRIDQLNGYKEPNVQIGHRADCEWAAVLAEAEKTLAAKQPTDPPAHLSKPVRLSLVDAVRRREAFGRFCEAVTEYAKTLGGQPIPLDPNSQEPNSLSSIGAWATTKLQHCAKDCEVDLAGWTVRVWEPERFRETHAITLVAVDPYGCLHDISEEAGL